ncbi:hypothetical protein [Flaviaesturariibacter amylovorans]|uniref:Macroglobulin domain-containing protein n=1 Tax=Flaviaesturariibacter amylovorans TaxID=1084520 RepID=A0ABP8GZW1_9BACT
MLLLLQAGQAAFCQAVSDDSLHARVVGPYSAHFSPKREVFYIHANKELFLAGEPLAFKVYVSDARHKRPFLETHNIRVDLYGPTGEKIAQQVLYAEGGCAAGTLPLPASLKTGRYWLRAYTAWSLNFSDHFRFTLPVQVLGKGPADKAVFDDGSGLGIYAEGGAFVAGVPTRFGLKLSGTDGSGYGATLEISKNGTLYETLTTNELGFASTNLTACVEDSVTATWVQPSGVRRSVAFPKPVARGVSLSVTTGASGAPLVVSVHTNRETLADLGEKKFYLMLHRQGVVSKLHWISFVNRRTTVGQTFSSDGLPEGVLHITLFGPDLKPIADRAVFLATDAPAPRVEASLRRVKDSVRVDITTVSGSGRPVAANLSMSFLPAGTRADGFRSSLLTKNLLEQELRGVIEYPLYYFKDRDPVRLRHLDELLIVQGWSSYDWNAILSGAPRPERFPFEQGFSIRGRVVEPRTSRKNGNRELVLSDLRHHLFLKTAVDSSGAFRFDRVFLHDPASVSLLTTDGQNGKRRRSIVIDTATAYSDPARPVSPLMLRVAAPEAETGIGVEDLQEVIVDARIRNRWSAGQDLTPLRERVVRFSDNDRLRYVSLKDYLKVHYSLREYTRVHPVTNIETYHVSFSFSSSVLLANDPVLVIDGVQVSDLQLLGRISPQDIESVSVNTTGSMDVPFGSGGHIIVKMRSPLDYPDRDVPSNVLKQLLLRGYSLPSAYYRPAYRMPPRSALFEQFACLFWVPDIVTDTTGRCSFMMPDPDKRAEIGFLIEGKGSGGECFYARGRTIINE